MAVDIQQLFNEELPANLAKHADAAKRIGAKLQIQITGEGGGEWFVDATDSGPSVTPGTGEGAHATITVSTQDFGVYYENPRGNGISLLFSGKLKIDGNQTLGMKLAQLLTMR
ncbi:MAG TPA: SCP2 sterol-binding domain-containing protein [Polyangiaceae bacterium]|nr:SCP2 sterol-binding domain-containing protein [Polyangiaceae bacterium]